MTFRDGLIAGRSHIAFLVGLLLSTALIVRIEQWERDPTHLYAEIPYSSQIPERQPAPLTAEDKAAATIAWTYLTAHTRAATGLVDPAAGNRAATLWNVGSQILGTLAAERLDLVTATDAEARIDRVLAALSRVPLFDGALPSRFLDTETLQPVTHDGRPTEREDLGWSAVDLGRLLNALDLWGRAHPRQAPAIAHLLAGWRLDAAVADRALRASIMNGSGKPEFHQEGRLGYGQYAAKGFQLFGFDLAQATDLRPTLGWVEVDGVEVPVDRRAMGAGTRTHTLSEPWMFDGLEYGFDRTSRELAWRTFLAQERRFEHSGQLTGAGEGPLDRAPWFAQATVQANGKPWRTLDDADREAAALRTVATKAAFGWDALFATDYAARLRAALTDRADATQGWYAGFYEVDGTTNKVLTLETNALVLEAMAARRDGPLRPAVLFGRRAETS
ncbi:DUF3131 domain-containing protein [Nitrospirillum amazonense]|uniref:DUF3131 domain-containing protein n=1 Tax=Nitrospirillum amazonense TaxID=28077 RepID=UPI0024122FFB|nr:DUF3131 domain-containing protein [Nitrospirillum amazonense]MDG3441462.1 DUF3131 domain-containing protein [Nitrospirillum amazonense]